jgi:(1->4)-alpha-D-glucan 1-alpha-D-glucosylmutase
MMKMVSHADKIDAVLDEVMTRPRLPRATYRLQFGPDFAFQDALALVDYLDALGISDLYASPLFKPRSESTHGYDVVDYNQLNPGLGSAEEFDALTEMLRGRGMGLLLDIVPNHMGVNTENDWWMDVLKHGPSSVYGHYFDIDWYPPNRAIDNKVVLPVLGDHYGRVLEAGEMEVVYWHGDFYIHYYEHQFPITPETYGAILRRVHACLLAGGEYEEWAEMELSSVITSLDHLPHYTTTDEAALEIRRREQVIVRWRLLGLFDKSEAFRTALQAALDDFNGDPEEPASFDDLDELLSRQPYRLSYWRVATDEINYRRFFDINDMAAMRIENPQVFAHTHRLTLQLLAEGKVSGLRIDHPDGLWDPETYFLRLQEAYLNACIQQRLQADAEAHAPATERLDALRASQVQPPEWPLYVLVEKILSETEPLPYSWAVYGTTGYDFMYVVNNLFVDGEHEAAFDALYTGFIGDEIAFHELTDSTKKLVMSQSLTSEIDARSAELARIVEQNRLYRGFTRNSLAFGLSEIIAGLSVYRTYITGPGSVTERDRHYIERAVALAKQRNPLTPSSVFDFLQATLLMDNWPEFTESQRGELREFVMKFQQITGPVMAKSMEDTAFYIYNRLASLNEVGGHPDRFGMTAADFHAHNSDKAFPYTMLSSSTHDTKRSEDVRARLNVLSEMPQEWARAIEEWARLNDGAKTSVNDSPAPTRNDEYLLYQSFIGIYPDDNGDLEDFRARIIAYMHKAINEAKTHSNWINPNDAYAIAIADFVTGILDNADFVASFTDFQRRVAFFGRFNSLAQTLLKLTSPGTPDIYQGNELWDYSLVDPDNRRPVDFEKRRALLAELKEAEAADPQQLARKLVDEAETGAIKLYLTCRALNYRREHEALFREGTYAPLEVRGQHAQHVCAFLRQHEDATALVIVPRLVVRLARGELRPPVGADVWGDTHLILPDDAGINVLENVFTGETLAPGDFAGQPGVSLAAALADFPVGLLATRADENGDDPV